MYALAPFHTMGVWLGITLGKTWLNPHLNGHNVRCLAQKFQRTYCNPCLNDTNFVLLHALRFNYFPFLPPSLPSYLPSFLEIRTPLIWGKWTYAMTAGKPAELWNAEWCSNSQADPWWMKQELPSLGVISELILAVNAIVPIAIILLQFSAPVAFIS